MFNYIWPISLVIFSNIVYQICAKSLPADLDPFASLVITYSVGTIISLLLYLVMNKGGNLLHEYSKLNLAPFVLGIILVGLEVGILFAYKNGWEVSTLSTVQSAFLAVALLLVGWLLYREAMTWNKVIGVAICLVGLMFINKN